MKYDLSTLEGRLQMIKDLESEENRQRKARSLREYEIFQKRQKQFVIEYLMGSYAPETVKEIPIIHSINLCNRIVKEQASLYADEPVREFQGVNNSQKEMILKLYEELNMDAKLRSMNEYFKLQDQAHIGFTVKNKKLKARILLPHHLDVIPNEEDPEVADGYVISNFDKWKYLKDINISPTGYKGKTEREPIAKMTAKEAAYRRYVVWTREYNFTMDGNGMIVSNEEDISNPIAPIMPFVEASNEKDFCYWIRSGSDVAEFSIQFNGMFSDLQNVVKMQGWGQAVFVGTENQIPEHFVVGMNSVIRLTIDPSSQHIPDFKYVSPSPDLQGSLSILVTALSTFMSANGVDPGTISTDGSAQSYASAIDRLLAMISDFEASKEDFATFRTVESQAYEIIKAMVNTWGGTDYLETDIVSIPEDSTLSVVYAEPQSITTKKEDLELIEKRKSMKLISRVGAYMEYYQVDRETAEAAIAKIDQDEAGIEDVPPAGDDLPNPVITGGDQQMALNETLQGADNGGSSGAQSQ